VLLPLPPFCVTKVIAFILGVLQKALRIRRGAGNPIAAPAPGNLRCGITGCRDPVTQGCRAARCVRHG